MESALVSLRFVILSKSSLENWEKQPKAGFYFTLSLWLKLNIWYGWWQNINTHRISSSELWIQQPLSSSVSSFSHCSQRKCSSGLIFGISLFLKTKWTQTMYWCTTQMWKETGRIGDGQRDGFYSRGCFSQLIGRGGMGGWLSADEVTWQE